MCQCRCRRKPEASDLLELVLQIDVNCLTWLLGRELRFSERETSVLNY